MLIGVLACGLSRAQSPNGEEGSLSPPPDSSTTPSQISRPIPTPYAVDLSLWMGGSLSIGELIGNIPRGQFGVLGVRYSQPLRPPTPKASIEGPLLVYMADLLPLAFLSIPPNTIPAPISERREQEDPASATLDEELKTYGFGARPIGFRINYLPTKRVQPFIAASAGFVYFLQSVPDERGKHLNFTFDVGAGLRLALTTRMVVTVGYRYHHLSNGFRGKINPGVDANLFYLGLSLAQ